MCRRRRTPTATAQPDDREQIRQLVKKINAAWLAGRAEELAQYFHENMVIVAPGFEHRAEGRDACIESYKDFWRQAVVREYSESEASVERWRNTAVASYTLGMAYEMGGQSFRESGRDILVFVREQETWLAVWRTMILFPTAGENTL